MSPFPKNNVLGEPVAPSAYSRPIHTSWFHIGYVTKNAVAVNPYRATGAEGKVVEGLAFNSFLTAFAEEGMSYLVIVYAAIEDERHYYVVGLIVKAERYLRFIIGRLNRGMGVRPSRRKRTRRRQRGGGSHTYVFYHIYCDTTTLDIVQDQVMKMIYSGLYAEVKQIYCFLAGSKTGIQQIEAYIETLPSKFKVQKKGEGDTSYERFTLNAIKDLVTDADKFLYLHTKGVTRTHHKGAAAECVTLWRNYMEYYLIALYKKCLARLTDHDVAGCLYKDVKIGPHFSGNFWWSTGKYFRQLISTEKIGDQYYDSEAYILKGKPKVFHVDNMAVANEYCLYSNPLFPKLYVDRDPV